MTTFKLSGNQTAIKEIMNLLDPNFIPPFTCRCPDNNGGGGHQLICQKTDKYYEENFGPRFEIYEIEYCEGRINSAKLMHKYSSNLLDGCVE